MSQEENKICFVIAPIDEEGSEIRRRSDQVLNYIIAPVVKELGYEVIRADKISKPGIITSQIIQHLIDDLLVIADLTGRNPNVFYELAIRHAIKRPIVQIIQTGEPIPFDVASTRTIQVDHTDLDSVGKCKEELIRQIRSVEDDPSLVDTPVSTAIELKFLRQSENPLEKSNAEIISMLQDLKNMMGDLTSKKEGLKAVFGIDPSGNLIDASGNPVYQGRVWATAYESEKDKTSIELSQHIVPEHVVYSWLINLVGDTGIITSNKDYPDFIVENKENKNRVGYEVKYPPKINLDQLNSYIQRGHLEILSGSLNQIKIILIINNISQIDEILQILVKQIIPNNVSIIIGTLEHNYFRNRAMQSIFIPLREFNSEE